MDYLDGQIFFVILSATVLAVLTSMLIARKYKAKILDLMLSGESPIDEISQPPIETRGANNSSEHSILSLLRQNNKARQKYNVVIIGLSLVLSFVISIVVLQSASANQAFSLRRLLLVLMVYAWPMIPCLGLLARWSHSKIVGLSLIYMLLTSALVFLYSLEGASFLSIFFSFISQMMPPLLAITLLGGPKTRTLGPYLLLVFFALLSSSLVGFQVLNQTLSGNDINSWIIDLAAFSNAYVVFALFFILPWLIAYFPLRLIARRAANAYTQKLFSDPLFLIFGVWLIVMMFQTMTLSHGVGLIAYTLLLSLLIIPLTFFVLKGFLAPRHTPPTLLLLRVFREDDGIGKIFDDVLERWRFSGNSVMIGGKDLAIRSLEPDELFNFLNGNLKYQFISDESRLKENINQLDFKPDPDGRYRINEFFCFDSTWKIALNALVSKADFVLMDLRDYHVGRQGCSYELNVLANSPHLQKIVMVANNKTDIKTATQFLGKNSAATTWVKDEKLKAQGLEDKMLASLLA